MIRNIVIALILIGVMSIVVVPSRAQDGIYGDYLITSVQKTVSLDLEDANLVDVLKLLSQQTSLNFISTEAVQERKLTLYLEKVPLKEALDIMFKANNLSYEYYPEGNIFVVKEMGKPTIELVSKVYRLKYVRLSSSRMEKEIKNVIESNSSTLTTVATAGGGGSGGSDSGGGTSAGSASGGGAAASKEKGIKSAIEKVLSEYGKITEDPLTNSLIVVDVPSQIPLIDEVVKGLDVPVPKVLIEVEMLDVSKQTMEALGVTWPQTMASLGVTGNRLTSFPFGQTSIGTDQIDQNMVITQGLASSSTIPTQNWASTFGTTATPFTIQGDKFSPSVLTILGAQLTLDFLTQQRDTKRLARPKILTLSNETAEVRITTNEAIGIQRTDTGGGAGAGGGTSTYTVERANTGTALRVTPQVNLDTKEITLFVESVETQAKDSGFTVPTFIGGTVKNPEERSARAIARLYNGETLLLGGMITNRSTQTNTEVPGLSKIPLVGKLFKHKSKPLQDNEQRELLVFLTPRIIEDRPMMLASEGGIAREQDSFRKESIGMVLDKYSR